MQVSRQSWLLAALFLLISCSASYVIATCASVYDETNGLPHSTELLINFGPVACPLLGITYSVAVVLTNGFAKRKWALWVLLMSYLVLMLGAFLTLFTPIFGLRSIIPENG